MRLYTSSLVGQVDRKPERELPKLSGHCGARYINQGSLSGTQDRGTKLFWWFAPRTWDELCDFVNFVWDPDRNCIFIFGFYGVPG